MGSWRGEHRRRRDRGEDAGGRAGGWTGRRRRRRRPGVCMCGCRQAGGRAGRQVLGRCWECVVRECVRALDVVCFLGCSCLWALNGAWAGLRRRGGYMETGWGDALEGKRGSQSGWWRGCLPGLEALGCPQGRGRVTGRSNYR